jgi:hypothetical protein
MPSPRPREMVAQHPEISVTSPRERPFVDTHPKDCNWPAPGTQVDRVKESALADDRDRHERDLGLQRR